MRTIKITMIGERSTMTTIKITMISGKVNYENYKDNYDWWKGQL